MLRSVLEGVTMNLSICLDILRTQMDIKEITVVGGGAKGGGVETDHGRYIQCQNQGSILLEEGSSMGAAVIGGVGTGIFKETLPLSTDSSILNPYILRIPGQ